MRRTAGIKNKIRRRVERREKPSDLRIPLRPETTGPRQTQRDQRPESRLFAALTVGVEFLYVRWFWFWTFASCETRHDLKP